MADGLHLEKFSVACSMLAFSTFLNGAARVCSVIFRHEFSAIGHAELTQIFREGTALSLHGRFEYFREYRESGRINPNKPEDS